MAKILNETLMPFVLCQVKHFNDLVNWRYRMWHSYIIARVYCLVCLFVEDKEAEGWTPYLRYHRQSLIK